MSHAMQSPLTPNNHQQRPVQYCSFPEWPCAWTLKAPLNGQIARAFVLSQISWDAAGGPLVEAGPGHPVYRWHLDSSHVRRPHFSGVLTPSLRKGRQDQFTYRGKEDGLMISGVDMRLYHV
jgi:hypothetical protein